MYAEAEAADDGVSVAAPAVCALLLCIPLPFSKASARGDMASARPEPPDR